MHIDLLGLDFLGLAYVATGLMLACDYLLPRIRFGQVRRAISQRFRRADVRKSKP